MQIKFCGAAREVTGSCHLLTTRQAKILVDGGMFQGSNFSEGKNHDDFPFDPKEIKAVVVTHAHLDHVGRLPKLVRQGFSGRIYLTKATAELAVLIWQDAFQIMKENQEKYATPLLYSESDIAAAAAACVGVDYEQSKEVCPGIEVCWHDAGHIFGSAFLEIQAEGKTVIFSGDIGNENVPIVRDTVQLPPSDYLVLESTYGDRLHESVDQRQKILLDLIVEGAKKGGTIMMPAFSLERTQEILYELNFLSEHQNKLPPIPIYLDSPLAISALPVYRRYQEYYDEGARELVLSGDDFLDFPQLKVTRTREESKKLNNQPGAKMIIAGAGMMNGGRIVHHAFHHLSDPASTLLIVGYQAEGTLGRRLYEGAKTVKIFNEEVLVHCTVKAIGALSAHADQAKLLAWVGKGAGRLKQIFCVHGEAHAATELAHRLRDHYPSVEALVPEYLEEFEL
ncbi:MAG TPA: MBL fold metallo-hydrolase [Patescibacteria group bacterium]|nr:MBL fold metallo-hydrolase [Patescibacteria group bacterium]